jgi:hypothetical protein
MVWLVATRCLGAPHGAAQDFEARARHAQAGRVRKTRQTISFLELIHQSLYPFCGASSDFSVVSSPYLAVWIVPLSTLILAQSIAAVLLSHHNMGSLNNIFLFVSGLWRTQRAPSIPSKTKP